MISTGCTPSPWRRITRKSCLQKNKSKNLAEYEETEYSVPHLSVNERPVVAGFGPGGMFAALVLEHGGT